MPDWAEKVMNPNSDIGRDFEYLALQWYRIFTITNEMKKLKSGYLLKEILDRFTNKTQSTLSPDRSLWMYFAHDITVSNMLNSLGVFEVWFFCQKMSFIICIFVVTLQINLMFFFSINTFHYLQLHQPQYGACIFFELFDRIEPYVRISYKNSTKTNDTPLKIPNCGTNCPLYRLYELYVDILPTKSYTEECALRDNEFLPPAGNPETYSL